MIGACSPRALDNPYFFYILTQELASTGRAAWSSSSYDTVMTSVRVMLPTPDFDGLW